jgi:hypothetical protein
MANILTTKAVTATATSLAVLLLAANRGRQYLNVSLPVASTLFVGGPGVTTTGAGTGFAVTSAIPFVMQAGNDIGGVGIYQGDLWGVATAVCTATIVEAST